MTDHVSIDLNTIDQVDSFSKEEAESSQDISIKIFVGKAVCVCTDVDAKQEDLIYFKPPYSCYAILPKLKIESVLELEMPVTGDDNKPIKKNGIVVMKARKLDQKEQAAANAKFKGLMLEDTILLGSELEKSSTKKRRANIAMAFGIMQNSGGSIPANKWYEIRNKKVVISTKNADYTPKGKTEIVKKHEIRFDGYEPFNISVENKASQDFSDL